MPFRIGVVLEGLKKPLRAALDMAPALGVGAIQVDAVGDLNPGALSQTGQREFRSLLRARGLEFAALHCPLRRGFDEQENLEARISYVSNTLQMAFEMGCKRVLVSAGRVPEDKSSRVREIMRDSLITLGRTADRVGATLGMDAGLEPPEVLTDFIESLDCGGININIDPANMLMGSYDLPAAVRTFEHLIFHTHARDALPRRGDRLMQAVPPGHGDVNWIEYLGVLEEVGYTGPFTIRPTGGDQPAAEVRESVGFLKQMGIQ